MSEIINQDVRSDEDGYFDIRDSGEEQKVFVYFTAQDIW
jgi:hypothetical protein